MRKKEKDEKEGVSASITLRPATKKAYNYHHILTYVYKNHLSLIIALLLFFVI